MRLLLVVTTLALTGCAAAVECHDGADLECLRSTATPEDIEAAIAHAGPCYAAGAALCAKADYCGALPDGQDAEACTDWWIGAVCLDLLFDPDQMDHCAAWANDLACPYFTEGAAYYGGNAQPCEDEYPHPLGTGTP